MKDMISVALCTYNGAKYIEQQLRSILGQTKSVDEIIVSDDNSTDNTLDIVEEIAKTNSDVKFRILRNKTSLGVCGNFKQAMEACTGDIIFLSDQDDEWLPEKVSVTIEWFEQNPDKDVAFSDGYYMDDEGESFTLQTMLQTVGIIPRSVRLFNNGFDLELFLQHNRATGAAMAMRKSCLEYVKIDVNATTKNLLPLHDFQIALAAVSKHRLGIIEQPLIKYRVHNSQECGFGEWMMNPPKDNDPAKAQEVVNRFLPYISEDMRKRALYGTKRKKYISRSGGIQILTHLHKYFKYYGFSLGLKAITRDFQERNLQKRNRSQAKMVIPKVKASGAKFQSKKTDEPLVSVVVTSYNYAQFIGEAIESLLAQTYKNIEIIVVDDGSKDNSVDIIKGYQSRYDSVHLLTHPGGENRGLKASMILAVQAAKGEYIAFCESDDYLAADNIEKKIDVINTYEDVAIISNDIKVFGEGEGVKVRQKYLNVVRKYVVEGGFDVDTSFSPFFNCVPTFSCVMIKKSVLMSLDFNTPIPGWLDFWLYRQIFASQKLFYISEKLTFWRQHESMNAQGKAESIEAEQGPKFIIKSKILIDFQKRLTPSSDRILLISHEATNTGGAILALNIARSLYEQGKQVIILLLAGGAIEKEFEKYGIVYQFSEIEQNLALWFEGLRSFGVDRCIQNTSVCGTTTKMLLRNSGYKVVSLIHECGDSIEKYGWDWRAINAFSDYLVFPSIFVLDTWEKCNMHIAKKEKIVINPQGIIDRPRQYTSQEREELRRKIRQELNVGEDTPLILSAATIEERKGIDMFVEVADKLKEEGLSAVLVWLGEDPTGYLESKKLDIRINKSSNIKMLPFQKNLNDWIVASDVFFLPSTFDPFPIVAVMAATAGTPLVVCEGCTGVVDFCKKFTRGVVKEYTTEIFTKEITDIITDKELADTIHREELAFMKDFHTVEEYVQEIVGLFEKIKK